MYQRDASIIERINVQTDAVVINQDDRNMIEKSGFVNDEGNLCQTLFISTTERGLSKSRNLALKNAAGDICLICDDDELLKEGYAKRILNAFEENSEADVITFALEYRNKKFPVKSKKVHYIDAMKTSSLQIAFRRKSIINNGICFNEKMGSGTGNGGGEEVRFLFDCLDAGLSILYVPIVIATVNDSSESQWFKGYTSSYFLNKGWSNKMILGVGLACMYALYFSITHYRLYKKDCGFWNSLYCQFKGTFQNR